MLRVFLFLSFVSCLILGVGYSTYGRWGLLIAFFMMILWNFYIYFYSDQRLHKIFPSQQIEGSDPWKIYQTVNYLAGQAQVTVPRVFMMSLGAPTAFSVGVFRKSIFISKKLVEVLTQKELRAVLAHEVFHIKHLDTVSFGVASAVMSLCLFWGDSLDRGIAFILSMVGWKVRKGHFFLYLFMPLALFCLILIVSPKNDYKADQFAISVGESSEHLAQALWKLESYCQAKTIAVSLSMSHFFIVSPFKKGTLERYFFFMPSVEGRIRKLINRYPL